jgi:nuclear transport factor 2 (NTF2) superfamily protein
MAVQQLREGTSRNPRTVEEAKAIVKHVESLFLPWNVDALVEGFTDDCVIRFGTVPEFRGLERLREFFTTRSKRQKNYRLRKELRSLSGDIIANVWSGEWEDAESGVKMKGFGVETWLMRDGKVAVWEAAFNVSRADENNGVGQLLK